VAVTVSAAQAPRHGLQQVVVRAVEPAELPVQLPVLDVAHGITCTPREQYGSDFCVSIFSPRYLARYWIMESGGALELLDPEGLRRHDASGLSCPSLIATATRPDGKRQEQRASPRKHPYFNPLVIDGEDGQPDQLYDGGWHVHGFQGDLEHWWTEDWMIVRQRTAKPGDKVALHWPWVASGRSLVSMGRDDNLAAKLKPGKTFIIDSNGKRREQNKKEDKKAEALPETDVQAMFVRPHGYDYGYATFYLEGARLERGLVFHPGNSLVGFAFCTEAEFDGLLKKWQANPPSGKVDSQVTARYRGGHGAHPIPAEK
jgi:hypothetical protein